MHALNERVSQSSLSLVPQCMCVPGMVPGTKHSLLFIHSVLLMRGGVVRVAMKAASALQQQSMLL